MKEKYDISLLVKVAQMYYVEGLKQEEIAQSLKLSRSMISLYLSEARELGIVEISIHDPLLNNEALASQFMDEFQLDRCLVIPTSIREERVLRKIIAQRAIDQINQSLKDKHTVGLAWGRFCHQLVTVYVNQTHDWGKNVVPLIGGSNQTAPYFQINEMVRHLAEKMDGTPFFIHAPALVSDQREKELYFQSKTLQAIQAKWQSMDLVITGIGSLPRSKDLNRAVFIGEYEIFKELENLKAVGDICARYFTVEGEFIKGEYYNRTVAVPLEDLKKTRDIIALAGGKDKVQPILGALRTGIVKHLITDEQTAQAIVSAYISDQ